MSRMLWTTPASRGGCCFVSEGQIPARQKTPAWENVPLLLRRRLECQRREVTAGMAARGGRFIGIPSWRRRLTEALAGPVPQVGGATSKFLAALEGHGPSAGIRGGGWSLGGGLGGKHRLLKKTPPPNALSTIFKQLIKSLESLGIKTFCLCVTRFEITRYLCLRGTFAHTPKYARWAVQLANIWQKSCPADFLMPWNVFFWKGVRRMARQQVWLSSRSLVTPSFHFPPSGVTQKCHGVVAVKANQ